MYGQHPVRRGLNLTIETGEQPLAAPTTCIYSKSDGIVAWQCCTSLPAPLTENIEVHGSHPGYGHNLETLYVIADRLAQPEGRWRGRLFDLVRCTFEVADVVGCAQGHGPQYCRFRSYRPYVRVVPANEMLSTGETGLRR